MVNKIKMVDFYAMCVLCVDVFIVHHSFSKITTVIDFMTKPHAVFLT